MLTRRDASILRAAALWTFFVWGVFLRNLLFGDNARSFGFKAVHVTLAVVSCAFGVAMWRTASRCRRPSDRAANR